MALNYTLCLTSSLKKKKKRHMVLFRLTEIDLEEIRIQNHPVPDNNLECNFIEK